MFPIILMELYHKLIYEISPPECSCTEARRAEGNTTREIENLPADSYNSGYLTYHMLNKQYFIHFLLC